MLLSTVIQLEQGVDAFMAREAEFRNAKFWVYNE